MRRPPRKASARLFDARLVSVACSRGRACSPPPLVALRVGLGHTGADDSGRALAFAALIGGNVGLILVNRSWQRTVFGALAARNLAAWAVVGGATLFATLAFAAPVLRRVFRFGPADADDLALAAIGGLLSLAWFEALKLFRPPWLRR